MKLFPYAALSNLDFLNEPGYIAGVTNPMFKTKAEWYDVCAEIDIGKLKVSKSGKDFYNYELEKYFNMDLDFIRPIIQRIRHNQINDDEIRKCFENFTRLTVDLAFREEVSWGEDAEHDGEKLIDVMYNRVRRFQKTNMYKV